MLLGIAELSRISCKAEGQEAQIVLSSHLPTHFLAATRLDSLHWDGGIGNNHVDRLHRARIEDLEFRLGRDRLVPSIDNISHEPQCVVVVHIARHVGHDHHRLRGGEGVFLAARLTVFGVSHKHKAPAREGVGHGEAEGGATVFVGAQLREEERRLVEILAKGGLSRLFILFCLFRNFAFLFCDFYHFFSLDRFNSTICHGHWCGIVLHHHHLLHDSSILSPNGTTAQHLCPTIEIPEIEEGRIGRQAKVKEFGEVEVLFTRAG